MTDVKFPGGHTTIHAPLLQQPVKSLVFQSVMEGLRPAARRHRTADTVLIRNCQIWISNDRLQASLPPISWFYRALYWLTTSCAIWVKEGLRSPNAPIRHKAKRRRIRTVMQELTHVLGCTFHRIRPASETVILIQLSRRGLF